MTTKLDIESATFAELIARIDRGEEVELERNGAPFARVVACEREPRKVDERVFGSWAGKIWMSDDFDEPMTEAELAEWYDAPLTTE